MSGLTLKTRSGKGSGERLVHPSLRGSLKRRQPRPAHGRLSCLFPRRIPPLPPALRRTARSRSLSSFSLKIDQSSLLLLLVKEKAGEYSSLSGERRRAPPTFFSESSSSSCPSLFLLAIPPDPTTREEARPPFAFWRRFPLLAIP